MAAHDFSIALEDSRNQVAAGAVHDVNTDMPAGNEPALLSDLVRAVMDEMMQCPPHVPSFSVAYSIFQYFLVIF